MVTISPFQLKLLKLTNNYNMIKDSSIINLLHKLKLQLNMLYGLFHKLIRLV
jgi:hypothetical protein